MVGATAVGARAAGAARVAAAVRAAAEGWVDSVAAGAMAAPR